MVGILLPLVLASVWHLDKGAIFGTRPPVTTIEEAGIFGVGNVSDTSHNYDYYGGDGTREGYVRGSADDPSDNPPWSFPFSRLSEGEFYFAWTVGTITVPANKTATLLYELARTDSAEGWYNDGTEHHYRYRREWAVRPQGLWVYYQDNGELGGGPD